MPRDDVENIRRWANEAEIDYFSHFIKAWIPFNAWFRMRYDHDKSERAILDLIKSDGNTVRSSITRLLTETDSEAEEFKEHLAQLHRRLERQTLNNRDNRVTFTSCYVGPNPKTQVNDNYQGITYHLERGTTGHPSLPQGHIFCELTKTNSTIVFRKTQTKYNLVDLQMDTSYISLSTSRRSKLEAHYKSINPKLVVNLLDTSYGSMPIGVYHFCNNPENIFAGLVENLYSLRCLLFHGEVIPTSEINSVYESAYHLLKRFLKSIV